VKSNSLIISERPRPIWQIPIAALFFTIAFGFIGFKLYKWMLGGEHLNMSIGDFHIAIYFSALGVSFTSQKRIYVDINNSKFKPSFEVGPLKFGKWQTIHNYEYVSVFHQPLKGGGYIYEVNLWYDGNKHFQLYEKHSYEEAFLVGYQLSEHLNIDLLDATVPNAYKWIDKNEWKLKMKAASQTEKD